MKPIVKIDYFPICTLVLDRSGSIQSFNKELKKCFPQFVVNKNIEFMERVHRADLQRFQSEWDYFINNKGPFETEVRLAHDFDDNLWVKLRCVQDQEENKFIMVIIDISESKKQVLFFEKLYYRIRSIQSLLANQKFTYDEQLTQVLELGCQWFGMDVAFIRKSFGPDKAPIKNYSVDGYNDLSHLEEIDEFLIPTIINSEKTVKVSSIKNSSLRTDIMLNFEKDYSFLAVALSSGNNVKGILSFYSRPGQTDKLDFVDEESIKLLSKWIIFLLENIEFKSLEENLKQQLNQQLSFINEVLDASPDFFIKFSEGKKLQFASDDFSNEFKVWDVKLEYSEVTLYNTLCENIITFEEKFENCLKEQAKDRLEYPVYSPEGLKFYEIFLSPAINSDKTKAIVVTFRDITYKKESERELINAKNHALDSARAKSQFLANMSHEIRTPMNALIGLSDILSETELSEEQKTYIAKIQKAGSSLLGIINDILDLSKIDHGDIEIDHEDINLFQLSEEVVDVLSSSAFLKKLELTLDYDKKLDREYIGDELRIKKVLMNLVGNAIKFTEQGSVKIVISENKREDVKGNILIEVIDTGIGIRKENIERVFNPFIQEDSTTTKKFGGTGLGLSICQKLVKMMGGDIAIESDYGKGTNIFFGLELVPQKVNHSFSITQKIDSMKKHKPTQTLLPQAKPYDGMKILIVDDSEDNLFLIKTYLKKTSYQLKTASNGQEALDMIFQEKFDLVLMDMQMPVMDGFTAVEKLREWEKSNNCSESSLPIIALTAYAYKDDIEKTTKAGCDLHLAKPVKKKVLLEAIDKTLAETHYKKAI